MSSHGALTTDDYVKEYSFTSKTAPKSFEVKVKTDRYVDI